MSDPERKLSGMKTQDSLTTRHIEQSGEQYLRTLTTAHIEQQISQQATHSAGTTQPESTQPGTAPSHQSAPPRNTADEK